MQTDALYNELGSATCIQGSIYYSLPQMQFEDFTKDKSLEAWFSDNAFHWLVKGLSSLIS